jgi:hypothetical protein
VFPEAAALAEMYAEIVAAVLVSAPYSFSNDTH